MLKINTKIQVLSLLENIKQNLTFQAKDFPSPTISVSEPAMALADNSIRLI